MAASGRFASASVDRSDYYSTSPHYSQRRIYSPQSSLQRRRIDGFDAYQGEHEEDDLQEHYPDYPNHNMQRSHGFMSKPARAQATRMVAMNLSNQSANSNRGRELQKATDLLNEMFPEHVAKALRDGKRVEPESFECVTVFFSDIVGFTELAGSLSPMKVSDLLDRLYLKFDALSRKHDIFKVETIGDAWMGVTNVTHSQPDHTRRIANFARDAIREACSTFIDQDDPSRGFVQIRTGFHCGPVIANVVGSRNPHYTVIGDTVNTAARMESNSEPMRILCSEQAANLLIEQAPEIPLKSRGKIDVKGKGRMRTFWVNESSDDRIRGVSTGYPPEWSNASSSRPPSMGPSPSRHDRNALYTPLTNGSRKPTSIQPSKFNTQTPSPLSEPSEEAKKSSAKQKKKKREKDNSKKKKKKKKKKSKSEEDDFFEETDDVDFHDEFMESKEDFVSEDVQKEMSKSTNSDVHSAEPEAATDSGKRSERMFFTDRDLRSTSGVSTTDSSPSSRSITTSGKAGKYTEYQGKMLESFLRRNGQDDKLAVATAMAFESFLEEHNESAAPGSDDAMDGDEEMSIDASLASKAVVERILEKHNKAHRLASCSENGYWDDGSFVGSAGGWVDGSSDSVYKQPGRWTNSSGVRSEAGSVSSHFKPSKARVAFLEQESRGMERKNQRRRRDSVGNRSCTGTVSLADSRSYAGTVSLAESRSYAGTVSLAESRSHAGTVSLAESRSHSGSVSFADTRPHAGALPFGDARSYAGNMSLGDQRSLASFGVRSAPGAMGLIQDSERSFEDQLSSLTVQERDLVQALKVQWQEWGRVALPDMWYLKFARCSPGKPFTLKTALKSMKKYNRRYFGLSIASMEGQLRSKILFPVKNLKSRDGHDMFYMKPSRYYPRKMSKVSIIDNLVYAMDCMLEKEQAQCEGIGLIANMSDFRMQNFSVSYYHKFMMALQCKVTPTRVQLFLIVNPPSWFGSIWAIMKPMLHEEFRKKVYIISFHQMREHLAPGFQDFLPDDIYSGRAHTENIIEDFVANRKHIESNRLLMGDRPYPSSRRFGRYSSSLR